MLDINKGRGIVNRLLGKTNDGKENTDDDDIQIHQTNVKIGLKCPISLQRIKLPTKGETCKHADCFDLSPYLAVNHENPSWKCPHCNEYTPPNKLYRDAFFEDLLQRVGKVAVEVEFKDDAEHFRVIKSETPDPEDQEQEKSLDTGVQSASESTTKTPKVEPDVERNVISLLSDDEDEEHEKQEEENEVNGQQTAVAGNESNNYSTNGNRKRAADTEESIQTTQSESSVEKSPATPGNLVANKRSRHDDDSFQYQFAPMDANQLLNSFFALASASGNGTINNNDDNNNGNNGTQ
ncbi:MIZ/SP-RING zinc finger-domain-containing protein [Phascolomyces articulosus]|uniref:MIZ/SP-RING zinc finger-domain-containing protein n=1 Tax=Phascolomyces articulosus TaxID=60185 RepID=A0AAD5P7N1_9FUNG|nr:MIZ/SP-RING zinc finger-domain-containing protein [Phascolomyces articulosus]